MKMFVNILVQTVGFNVSLKFNTGVPQNRSWNTV